MSEKSRFLPHAERLVWFGFMLFLLITAMIYIHRGIGLERDVQQAHQEILALQMRLNEVTSGQVAQPAAVGLTQGQERRLRRLGLNQPREDLLNDLVQQPELIDHDPVLGGTLFFVPDETHVLNDRWVLATFEDGHIRGQMLLEYEVAFGTIDWRVLDSVLDR
ncbi:hypothetical protein M911_14895 [Ectothiorhodospira haloalkaliphila]|uniref:Uncharacterized protein n=1 Tax=Ectothiorhodospira haloalkaliphila TaxID=421628 RepID=W8KXG5_9GAMM|nr:MULTISPECIES: hypothetical protein [Ectothiorhodospira]AHK80226.1 hypothetical protein M911_14895 [Ectothiorhodospira haloalkaliphila]MCG5494568.1 hypothetical protein [Ectothiorhodospira variabilis]MCG5503559.1 hypothetical protein [Ectothiorhodospira variabilis]MCG5506726.1 hypothetical protein [Ectothiorhodospira variabilis]